MNGTVKLLVVDHDPATLENIAAAVGSDEVRLISAANAESGLELARREQPQIALFDPATAGMDLLDRLLEIDPGITVLSSARNMRWIRRWRQSAGARTTT